MIRRKNGELNYKNDSKGELVPNLSQEVYQMKGFVMTTKNWKLLAEQLDRELGLKHPAIAITFSDEAPQGVSAHEG